MSKKLAPTASDPVKGLSNHKDLYLWRRGSITRPANNIPVASKLGTCALSEGIRDRFARVSEMA